MADNLLMLIILAFYLGLLASVVWFVGQLILLLIEWLADEIEWRCDKRACKQIEAVPNCKGVYRKTTRRAKRI